MVNDEGGKLVPTKYFGILEDTVEKVYGSFDSVSTSDVSASGNTSTGDDDTATSDVSASGNTSTGDDDKETNLINKLVKTGKFTEAEAKQFVSKSMQNGSDVTSTSDNTQSSNTQSSSNAESSNNQTNNNDQPSNANTNNPEKYDNLDDLVDDIKNHVVDIEDISLNAFQDSGAYQQADQETQDCIDLAGKIGGNLGDQEIVNCSEDPNFYMNEISNTDINDDDN